MSDEYEFTLNSPLTDEDWDKITDTEFEHTDRISFRTKSGKTVEFAKVSEEFEWCHDCKEYDAERHCCPRWTKVIRNTVEELKRERPKGKWTLNADHSATCSVCGHTQLNAWDVDNSDNFCHFCGADMREDTDDIS